MGLLSRHAQAAAVTLSDYHTLQDCCKDKARGATRTFTSQLFGETV